MFAPARSKRPQRQQIGRTASLPAPIKGWNSRDALENMGPEYAVIMDNYVPGATTVSLRKGSADYATGITGNVESLMGLTTTAGVAKMLAAAGTVLYDATSPGAASSVRTGLTNARWQSCMFNATGTNLLYMVNGADNPLYWDGTTFTAPTITGITATAIVGVNSHQSRLWFCLNGTLKAAYLGVAAIAGAASVFDLGQVFREGGYLMAMATWTVDAGNGLTDLAAFITSEGEVAVYSGTDPTSATTWALAGIFRVGRPIGRRCFLKYGGDVLVICRDGLFPLSRALQSNRVNIKSAITDVIQPSISDATAAYGANFGWQICAHPDGNLLLLNVPAAPMATAYQYVLYTPTGAWCRFLGWDAFCWCEIDNAIYFGAAGKTVKAWTGFADGDSNINGEALQAFSPFGAATGIKHFKMARPMLRTNGSPSVLIGVNADFDTTPPSGPLSFAGSALSMTWGAPSMDWGSMVWGSGSVIYNEWQGVSAVGTYGAMHLLTASQGVDIQWASTQFLFENGGVM